MKYKVLAFDLDGTLTNSSKDITPLTRRAIDAAVENGCVIVLASGRPVPGILPVAKELELDKKGGYILAYNGGVIIDCQTGKIIYEQIIPEEYVKPICKFAAENDYAVLTYENNSVITNKEDNQYVRIEAGINHLPIRRIDNLGEYINFPVNKFLITEDPEIVSREIPTVKRLFPALNVFPSAPFFMEIVPPNIDKADTLERLCSLLGTTVEYLAAFGDGGNDVTMLKRAGLGVAMSNACDEVKAAADYISLSNDEDGCGIAIEKMLNDEL